jgi:large subunit ribosomal protein L7Ae
LLASPLCPSRYKPETKQEKKLRLKKAAENGGAGKTAKPIHVKFGLNHITDLVESGKAALVVIAHDVDPIELVVWLPALCRKMGVPYLIVKGKARLGSVVHQKNAAALALTEVKGDDSRELAKVVESANALFGKDGPRIGWGGGIMGAKSQAKTRKREKTLARELASR